MKKKKSFSMDRHLMFFVVVVLLVANFSWARGNPMQSSSSSEKSPDTALALSLMGTALSLGLTAASSASKNVGLELLWFGTLVLGPAPGYFYGGLAERGVLGMGIRAGGVGMCMAGVVIYLNHDESGLASVLMIAGMAAVIGSMIYDLAKVSSAVRNHNLKLRERRLKISPTYIPQAKAFGIKVQVQF